MTQDEDVAALLRAAAADIDVRTPPVQALARAGRQRRRRRRLVAVGASAAAVATVAVGLPLATGLWDPPSAGGPATPSAGDCVERVPGTVLPGWARDGFSDPEPRVAHVSSRHDELVAILFAQPLTSPPSADHSNKILWVARPSSKATGSTVSDPALRIRATLEGGSTTVTRVVESGPGPSIVNLPQPGCWHLTLRWAGRTDSLDLAYVSP